jgi:hypothetical protein
LFLTILFSYNSISYEEEKYDKNELGKKIVYDNRILSGIKLRSNPIASSYCLQFGYAIVRWLFWGSPIRTGVQVAKDFFGQACLISHKGSSHN